MSEQSECRERQPWISIRESERSDREEGVWDCVETDICIRPKRMRKKENVKETPKSLDSEEKDEGKKINSDFHAV